MYPKYFGLKEPSFSIAPDPHYLFLSEQHKEALAHLLYGAGESGGFVLLTGEVGTGKTTVCRAFLEQLPEGVDVALILNPAMTANELLLSICDEFRIAVPRGGHSTKLLVDRLNLYLLESHASGRRPVLMIDEAQNLKPKVLEQIRLLTNLETTKHKLLQIFLVGQPELRRLLDQEGLRQINQRITARFHLRPLGLVETGEYIRHRVAVGGVDRPLFTAAAVRRIHQVSGGVPRLINILCDRALLGACVTRVNQVTPTIVARAAREVQGERLDAVPSRASVRPAFGAAAALTLLLAALWLGLGGSSGTPEGAAVLATLWDRWSAGVEAESGGPVPPGAERAGAGRVPASDAAAELADRPLSPSLTATGPADLVSTVQSQVPTGDTPAQGPAVALPSADIAAAMDTTATPEPAATPSPILSDSQSAGESLPQISLAVPSAEAGQDALAALALDERTALRVLLRRWGIVIQDLGGGDPCSRVVALGLRCERERGRLSNVRYFDRPVLLRVGDLHGGPGYAVLGRLDLEYATFDLESGAERIPIADLESVWGGEFRVLWQPPPTGASLIRPGAGADSVRWLRRVMAEIPGGGLPYLDSDRFDSALVEALRAFQRSRGLEADGIAGPRTLIQLHNAAGTPGIPRLLTEGAASVNSGTALADAPEAVKSGAGP